MWMLIDWWVLKVMIEMVLFIVRCFLYSVFLYGYVCDMCKALGFFEFVLIGYIKGCIVVIVDGMGSFIWF